MAASDSVILNAVVILTGFYVLRLLAKFAIRYRKLCIASRNVEPLFPMHPIFGAITRVHDMESFMTLSLKLVQQTKVKLFHAWIIFLYPVFLACHPDTVKVLLKSTTPKARFDGNGGYKNILPWLGDGLLTSHGEKWERNRKLLTPAFHFDVLRSYLSVFNEEADVLLKTFQETNVNSGSMELERMICNVTLDTIIRCCFSNHGFVQEKRTKNPYGKAIKEISILALDRIRKPWFYSDFIYRISPSGRRFYKNVNFIHKYDEELIRQRRKQLENNEFYTQKKRRLDFLDILLSARDESGQGLSDEEIRNETATFLFAGHDTTSMALSWALYCCGKYPDIQEKLYAEVQDVLGEENNLKWEDLSLLKYQIMFIKEVLRMYSVSPIIGRYLPEPMVLDGVEIPEGCTVYLFIHCLHHHPDVWPDHEEFRPERFSEDQPVERDPFAFVPFSAGSRNCIGQNFALNEIRVFLSKILKRYRIFLDKGHTIKLSPMMVMRSKYGIKVKLEERKDAVINK